MQPPIPHNAPYERFQLWLDEARARAEIKEPTAMTLATVNDEGHPRARIVLLKAVDHHGFSFFTNHHSHKGEELLTHPHAALVFYWMPLGRQVRVEGTVTVSTDAEADTYFASRPRGSQIGAWASLQSQPLDTMDTLRDRVAKYEVQFEGLDVPRPPHWSGFLLHPHRIEFWEERPFRLHEREIYTRLGDGWELSRLYP